MMVLSRVVLFATGVVVGARSLLEFAHPDYWDPVTALDWAAVWLTSIGWILFALSILWLGRLAPTRSVIAASLVVAAGAILTGAANVLEDGFGFKALGTFYVIGIMTAGLMLPGLAWAFRSAHRPRLGWLSIALFVGILLTNVGGGVLVALSLWSVAAFPAWYGSTRDASPSVDPVTSRS